MSPLKITFITLLFYYFPLLKSITFKITYDFSLRRIQQLFDYGQDLILTNGICHNNYFISLQYFPSQVEGISKIPMTAKQMCNDLVKV